MRTRQYKVILNDEEKQYLQKYVRSGKRTASSITRVRILIMASEPKSDEEISKALSVCTTTVFNIRKRYNTEGMQEVVKGKASPGRPSGLDMKAEATMIAIACSQAPEGYAGWTMQMIADKMIELTVVETISDETVRRHLKKAKSSRGSRSSGV